MSTPDRDVAAFEARATTYDGGWLGRMHRDIADRTAVLALSTCPGPRRILDVGCGTGYLLRSLAGRCPEAEYLGGVDAAAPMVAVATGSDETGRITCRVGVAEHLPHEDHTFDLVVSTTSFDHWSDQLAGLRECARVLRPGGSLVLVDQFSWWTTPTLLVGRRGKARTTRRCAQLLETAGFRPPTWHHLYASIIKAAVTATSSGAA